MAHYWLAPIVCRDPLTLGEERFAVPPDETARLIEHLRKRHPRALIPFKASMLLDDESGDRCGSDDILPELGKSGPIAFDGVPYRLSGCADAYLNSLLDPAHLLSLLERERDTVSPPFIAEVEKMTIWLKRGQGVILLKEGD